MSSHKVFFIGLLLAISTICNGALPKPDNNINFSDGTFRNWKISKMAGDEKVELVKYKAAGVDKHMLKLSASESGKKSTASATFKYKAPNKDKMYLVKAKVKVKGLDGWGGGSSKDKFNLLLDTLQKYTKKDVRGTFPDDELEFILNNI